MYCDFKLILNLKGLEEILQVFYGKPVDPEKVIKEMKHYPGIIIGSNNNEITIIIEKRFKENTKKVGPIVYSVKKVGNGYTKINIAVKTKYPALVILSEERVLALYWLDRNRGAIAELEGIPGLNEPVLVVMGDRQYKFLLSKNI